MEPQQARWTLATFMVLSGFIIFNALYMQKDAGFATRTPLNGASFYEVNSASSHQKPADQKVEGRELEQAIRRELSQRNYFPGTSSSSLDGRMDAMTMGAIMAYQNDVGLPVTGHATDGLLKSFLFGVAEPVRKQGQLASLSVNTHHLVAEIQGILSAKGHYGGKIDGIFKGQTSEAVRRFETDRGLPVTGRISGLLVQELSRLTGVVLSAN